MTDTIILGAGVAGLAAARDLAARGHNVVVIDRGRRVGGRLATRRIGDAVLDHGAQFFTTRGDRFSAATAAAVADGAVVEWCRGFAEEDGYPRYRGSEGMASVATWMARDLHTRLDAQVHRIEVDGDEVRFLTSDGAVLGAGSQAVVTAPIPEMLALFDRGGVKLEAEVAAALGAVDYFRTLALMVVIDGDPDIAEPGGMQFADGPFTFIADNHRKGISPIRALTFHADHDYSRRRFDDDRDEVVAELVEMAGPWIGAATVVETELERWRYAGPVTPLPQRTLVVGVDDVVVALAGDAFGGPKVEGAFNSGVAAAAALAQRR